VSGPTCRNIRLALGVYVVGAIDPAERAIVEEHLSHCPECREELAGLAGLPALLGRVPLGDAERLALDSVQLKNLEEPPARLLSSLLDQVAARRKVRKWRVLTAAAAAAVVAVGGGLAGGMAVSDALGQHAAHSHPLTNGPELVRAVNPRTHVTADVSYVPTAFGTTMEVRVGGIKPGTHCWLWVTNSSGKRVLGGDWTATAYARNWYPASSPFSASSITEFQITSGGKVLISIPAS
jgi:Putative zinc-finger